jgi:type II secretory pathway component GspD/PulD (secretin)
VKWAGRALLSAAILLFGYVCTSSAQDAVSLAGVSASLKGDAAIVELHTTGSAEFQVDRFTMGEWVTVWSRSFQSSGVKEIPLEFPHPELADLVTGVSLVTENSRPGIRIYIGPEAKRAGAFITSAGDVTQVFIPAVPGALLANAAGAPAGGDRSGAPLSPMTELSHTNSATLADAARTQQIAAEREDDAAQDADDASTAGNVFFVPRQELVEPTDGTGAADAPSAGPAAEQTSSGVAPGKFRQSAPVDFKPAPKAKRDTKPVPVAPQLPETSGVMLPSRITENLPENAQIHFQYPADESQNDQNKDGSNLKDVTLQDIMDQAAQSVGSMMGLPGAKPAAAAQAQTPGGIATPGSAPAYSAFQTPAAISAKLGPGPELSSGKDALSGIMIDLFEILGTPLDQALTLLIAPTEYNVIVDAEVGKNLVSLSFKESRTDLKTALDLLTRTYGLEYVVDANTIVIAGKDKINGSLVNFATRVFVLSYADPKSVKDMLVKTGQLRDDQVEIYQGEQAITAVNDSTQLSGASSGGGGNEAGGGAGTQIKPIETNLSSSPRNALLVKAVPSQMDQIAALITQLDRKPMLIELEVRVCEAQDKALKNLGISINGADTDTPISTDSTWTEQNNENGVIEAFTSGSFNRSPLAFLASLNTQIQERSVSVLAQPTLSTVEGKQAIYFAGETVPYISKVTQTSIGTQVEIAFLKLGVTLNFKPRLDADGKLTIDVNPIVSSLLEFRKIGDLMEAPRTSERQVATTVRVADCEPFVLAGLINEEERKTVTKIPFLADLPLVGKMFRNTNNNGQRTEIIIVVIPHIHE